MHHQWYGDDCIYLLFFSCILLTLAGGGGGGSEARIFYVMKGALHSNSYLFIPTHVAKPHILLSISGNNWTLMQQEWSTTEKPGL